MKIFPMFSMTDDYKRGVQTKNLLHCRISTTVIFTHNLHQAPFVLLIYS